MPFKQHPSNPYKVNYEPREYDLQSHANEYERGFIDGMQKKMQSSVDKAVNTMGKREWVELTSKEIKAIAKANEVILTGKMWVFIDDLINELKEKNT